MDSYIALYIFGNKYDVAKLRLDCINGMFRYTDNNSNSHLPNESTIELAYGSLSDGDPLLRMITDVFCQYADTTNNPNLWEAYRCVPFLQSLWKRFHQKWRKTIGNHGKQGKNMRPYVRGLCEYHDHANEDEMWSCEEQREGPMWLCEEQPEDKK